MPSAESSDVCIRPSQVPEKESNSSTESKAISTEKTKKGKKYCNKFSYKWLETPEYKEWLEKSTKKSAEHELAYCRVCDMHITAHKKEIHSHHLSNRHVFHLREIKGNFNLKEMVTKSISLQQRRGEVMLAGFLAEHNLPIQTIDTLVELIPNICTDSKIAQGLKQHRTKTTAVIKNSLGAEFKKELNTLLSTPGSYFSIVMDETTDMSSTKQCAFVVIYYDNQVNEIKTKFFDMEELKSSNADDLVQCLKDILKRNNVPLKNLIGFSSDTTNVMFGEHHSVVSLLKSELPDVVFIKCSCHLIHLVASKACLKLPRSVEDLLRNLGSHFSRSYHRQQKLIEFQQFFTVEIHKILTSSTTRWLSVTACVDRVLEQYTALNAYLRQTVFDDPSKTTEEMLNTMNSKFTEIYLEFMSYVLGLFTDFNTVFQAESPLLYKVKPEIQRLLKTLTSNYIQVHVVRSQDIFDLDHKNSNNFIAKEEIYLGIQAHESLVKLKNDPEVPKQELALFYETCQNFYVEAVSQIKKRFVFEDDIFSVVEIVDPVIAQSLKVRSLQKVFIRFSCLKENVNKSKAEQEWRDHALLEFETHGLDSSLPPEKYWQKVFSLKNAVGTPLFGELKKVIGLLMVLPFSNASVERVFSVLNNMKTAHRNRLKTETIVALMKTKEGITDKGGCAKFEPSPAMLKAKIWTTNNISQQNQRDFYV